MYAESFFYWYGVAAFTITVPVAIVVGIILPHVVFVLGEALTYHFGRWVEARKGWESGDDIQAEPWHLRKLATMIVVIETHFKICHERYGDFLEVIFPGEL